MSLLVIICCILKIIKIWNTVCTVLQFLILAPEVLWTQATHSCACLILFMSEPISREHIQIELPSYKCGAVSVS